MENKFKVRKVGLYYLVGNLFNKGIAFLTVPVFTRIMSTYDYGVVTTYSSWASILNMVLGCALTMGVRVSFVDYEDETDFLVSSVMRFTVSIGTIGVLIAFLILAFFQVNYVTLLVVVLCILQGSFWAIIDDYTQFLMMRYEYRKRTLLMILPNLLSSAISIFAILFLFNDKLFLGKIIPTALVYVCIGLYVCKKTYKTNSKDKEYLKYALSISLPLVVHGIALNILAQSDRTMITWLADASQTGIYSLIYNFSMLATVIATSLDGIWVPFFIENLKNRKIDIINNHVRWYILLMTLVMIELVLVGPEIVKILAAQPYWEGISIIPPIVLSNYLIFAYTLYVNTEHYYKKAKNITLYTVISAVINLVANYFLIPYFGYVAASYTTVFSYFVALSLHAHGSKKLEDKLLPTKLFVTPFLQIVVAVLFFYFFINIAFIRWSIAIVYAAFILVMNRNDLKKIVYNREGRSNG